MNGSVGNYHIRCFNVSIISAQLIKTRLIEADPRCFTFNQHPRGAASIINENIRAVRSGRALHGRLHGDQSCGDSVILSQKQKKSLPDALFRAVRDTFFPDRVTNIPFRSPTHDQLYYAVCKHRIGYFDEPGDVGTFYIIDILTFSPIRETFLVNVVHDVL